MEEKSKKNIVWFKDLSIKDVALVGGKNASLGEIYNNLVPYGVRIPNGFATTSEAYFLFLDATGLTKKIQEILKYINVHDLKTLQEKGKKVRGLIMSAELPLDLKNEIVEAYKKLSEEYKSKNVDVAVRSSATAEDLPGASFAGQQETFLNITGEKNVLEAVKKCFASLFTDRAIVYRQEMGFGHTKVGLSAGIQKMVRSDVASSGVMFSCDTESGFADVVLINASFGLGENVVLGRVEPDQYYIFESTLKKGFKPVIEKKIGSKLIKMVYTANPKAPTKNVSTSAKERQSFVLSDDEILQLAEWSLLVEEHYQKPMDMEWAKDGKNGKLYIVQARPETVQSKRNVNVLENYVLQKTASAKILAKGMSVGSKIGSGKANKIMSAKDINKFKKGEVLVTGMTDPDWVPAMKLASAIITDQGGRTAHAAIVSRELGIPCIVGASNATKTIKTGTEITVDCSGGEHGLVYQGLIPFKVNKTDISKIEKPKTKILMNLADPSQAFNLSFIPNDGVGLAREEFIIANTIKIHPSALINYKKLPSALRKKIDALSVGYEDKTQFYVDKLAEGVGKIGAAFYPKQVIVRFSDFKTNEYRGLIGGELYEPEEENPMIGFRGASRYYHEKFKEAFILECNAIKKAREEFGIDNIAVMVPFCRTVEEGRKVLEIMEAAGLKKGERGLKIFVMAEIPANIILAKQFLEIFDGFSIGSNDLAQLTLGLDRDNSEIAAVGNEKNEAVKELIKEVVKVCKEKGKYSGICGQAPSDFPDFAEFLVELGIESVSLNPDSIIKTMLVVSEKEKQLSDN
ncbi:MAG: phosphoenolpyruvate synthase [Candidatus Staskawiczbacteria bacterium RIFCSPLOWO2_01_FULL_40_39]|uniref:Phosphoenolpyruvate synthase n=1 Tax=Candidatus Staskawiczbacteria bacterium RIFCSPHIGHO2_01_FULL_39_25 TaxID=1802202 RepID=A0A1G2HR90_9BACT|nr:MAG: phosphoenolpyruvate synthase [Candidatus Staskawiczbacteria bacterium RIFCSPHIGHO2_01_FULL_39_25]OGZ72748.1 MAG: phosphoenolpyruvate synthase [Candidatus Staskawiczbacteria bacterium RIFCSPLOWO2_01_FULL_40_39]OGZ76752.1 MAG: phosphoenolpyruvate synthase [Candidatus Staskawiczbacteria bacterium RIFCSPLOWO2_02_FULL_39_8]